MIMQEERLEEVGEDNVGGESRRGERRYYKERVEEVRKDTVEE